MSRSAAVLTIKDGQKMTRKGVKNISKWLRKQADWFEQYTKELAPTFRARYLYR